jgi:hypothetical protein
MMDHPTMAELVTNAKHIYSSAVVNLNDASAEYHVSTIKHFFDTIIIVQYAITNTLDDHILTKVKIQVTGIDTLYNVSIQG